MARQSRRGPRGAMPPAAAVAMAPAAPHALPQATTGAACARARAAGLPPAAGCGERDRHRLAGGAGRDTSARRYALLLCGRPQHAVRGCHVKLQRVKPLLLCARLGGKWDSLDVRWSCLDPPRARQCSTPRAIRAARGAAQNLSTRPARRCGERRLRLCERAARGHRPCWFGGRAGVPTELPRVSRARRCCMAASLHADGVMLVRACAARQRLAFRIHKGEID